MPEFSDQAYVIISGAIFIVAYAFIIFDIIDRVLVSIIGAGLMVLSGVLAQETAFEHIDWNTLFLLIGMMIIVMIVKRTGIFEYLGIKTIKIAKGEPWKIMFLMAIITGVLSAFLDNVTTILLITPLTFSMAKDLELNPVPFVISNVFASNVGGTATLIGDPPNIMIGSSVGIPFGDFITNLALPIIIILLVTTSLFTLQNKKHLKISDEAKLRVINISAEGVIKDRVLLHKSIVILLITIVGFLFSGPLGYESSTIAIFMAGVFLLISKQNIPSVLEEVEWPVIFFFSGLFVMVGALVETGIIEAFAKFIVNATGDNFALLAIAIIWVSAIASAFIDNIPFVATMIPLIQGIEAVSTMDVGPLWWCLALGACLGGNGTLIGASANVVAAGMCEEQGYKVTFAAYTKKAFPLMVLSVALATVYVLIRYL